MAAKLQRMTENLKKFVKKKQLKYGSKLTRHSILRVAIKNGYRSGLEHKIAQYLLKCKSNFDYESIKIEWEDLCYRTYTPDFILANGIIIETKGRFIATDRRKHLAIKKQHPKLDIRFVFSNSKTKIGKKSKTTYAKWCELKGFKYHCVYTTCLLYTSPSPRD